jgi:hypothetical protein
VSDAAQLANEAFRDPVWWHGAFSILCAVLALSAVGATASLFRHDPPERREVTNRSERRRKK